ncbi:hypothetical protein CL659_06070, partial [bacterium]|nr:hypothetical protein [bacterium]
MNSLFPDRFEYINDKMCHHIPLTSEKIFFDDSHILLELDLVKIKKLKYHRILPVNIIKSIYCLDKEKKETYTPHIRDVEINTDLLVQKIKIIDEIDRVINIDYDVEKSRLNKEINIKLRFYFKLMGGMSYLKTSSLFSRLHISSLSSFYKEYLNEFNHEKVFVEPNVSIPWQIQLFFTLSNKKYINYMLFNKEYSVIWKTFLLLSTPLYENEISSCIKSNKMLIHQYIDKVLNYSGEKGVHGFDFTNFKEDIVKLDKNAITFNDIVNNYSLIKNDEYLPIFILLCIYKHPSLSKKSSDSESIKNLIKAQNFNSKYEDELLAL